MTGLPDLEIAWTGGNEYEVYSGPDDDAESDASNTYTVNLSGG